MTKHPLKTAETRSTGWDNDMAYNPNTIDQLIAEYDAAETHRERREIENEILAETVWAESEGSQSYFAYFTHEQFERITAEIDTEDQKVKALLRKPYLKLL